MKDLKNILVVSVNWLGDVIFSTPVYKVLKDNFPAARVQALSVPRVEEVLRLCPYVDDVIVYDEEGFDRPLLNKLSLIAKLRRQNFDAVFILRPSFSRTLLVTLAGIPIRVGFAAKSANSLLTVRVPEPDLLAVHRSDAYLQVLKRAGLHVTSQEAALAVSDAVRSGITHFLESRGLSGGSKYIVLNTGGNWDLKQWPWASFADLAHRLSEKSDIKVVFTGSSKDRSRVAEIIAKSGASAINIAGETDISQLAAVYVGAVAVVSADSGPLHLANALGTPVVGIFGPTRPEITGPRGRGKTVLVQKDVRCNRAPCYYLECQDNQCMKQIGVNDVLKALETFQS